MAPIRIQFSPNFGMTIDLPPEYEHLHEYPADLQAFAMRPIMLQLAEKHPRSRNRRPNAELLGFAHKYLRGILIEDNNFQPGWKWPTGARTKDTPPRYEDRLDPSQSFAVWILRELFEWHCHIGQE
jgi:hypothetical protein